MQWGLFLDFIYDNISEPNCLREEKFRLMVSEVSVLHGLGYARAEQPIMCMKGSKEKIPALVGFLFFNFLPHLNG